MNRVEAWEQNSVPARVVYDSRPLSNMDSRDTGVLIVQKCPVMLPRELEKLGMIPGILSEQIDEAWGKGRGEGTCSIVA